MTTTTARRRVTVNWTTDKSRVFLAPSDNQLLRVVVYVLTESALGPRAIDARLAPTVVPEELLYSVTARVYTQGKSLLKNVLSAFGALLEEV